MQKRTAVRIVTEALEGMPCEVFDYGVELNVSATQAQIIEILRSLLSSEQAVTVRSRFCMGDVYNTIPKARGLRKAVCEAVMVTHGENVYKMLRQYAWVASKWPRDRRTDGKPWSYYIRRRPGLPGQPDSADQSDETCLEFVSFEKANGENVFHLKTSTGRKFVLRLPVDPVESLPVSQSGNSYGPMMLHEERKGYSVR